MTRYLIAFIVCVALTSQLAAVVAAAESPDSDALVADVALALQLK